MMLKKSQSKSKLLALRVEKETNPLEREKERNLKHLDSSNKHRRPRTKEIDRFCNALMIIF